MTSWQYLQAGGIAIVAVALVVGATAKVTTPSHLRTTLDALGLDRRRMQLTVRALPAVELFAAALLVIAPSYGVVQALVLIVFAAFGVAGAWAIWRHRATPCACFGALHPHATLGIVQPIEFLVVCALMTTLWVSPPEWSTADGARGFVACLLLSSLVLLVGAAPKWRRIRNDRISFATTRRRIRQLAMEDADA